MADSGTMREVERWIRDTWLPSQVPQIEFIPQMVRLESGGYFQFDAVSPDGSIAVCVSTSAGVTSGGKKGTSHLHKIRSDMLFLKMALGVGRRIIVLTDELMWQICEDEKRKGRLPSDVDVLLAKLPDDLQNRLVHARRAAAAEVGG